ncbi:hypothetical protein HEK616_30580 [Streptomyces nigrescens]|uniref:C2H2-type domain-containing protein n=1 Tax=Streptomyces nigrescens TaxID=1920 RepID=A0ABM7ZT67_STRNI|nr:hypothetical protein [Streptomyces nigrescens]BDM69571.1 hypothetical protein HEK616_30580 [Streptomyces nigrescens]
MTASRAAIGRHDLRVKIAVQRVRLGGEEFRVIRPAAPLNNGALYETNHRDEMYVDRTDGRRIGTLWLLAARSPRSLVYLPMRTTPSAPGTGWQDEKPLDLVLAHRSLQFRPSRWKRLRERITAGNAPRELRTASVPEQDVLPDRRIAHAATGGRRNGDPLRRCLHAETLFLTGTTSAFRESARHVFAVTKEGPPAAATELYLPGPGCNYHACRSFYTSQGLPGHDQAEFHVAFTPRWVT